MFNLYEFGSETIQDTPNYLYESFNKMQELCNSYGISENLSEDIKNKNGAKITGAIVAEVFRKNIEYVLKKNNLSNMYKISENNVYVKGCHIEFDFLILKISAQKEISKHIIDSTITIELPIYNPTDVVAVLESKTYGIYSLYKGRTENTEYELSRNDLYRFVSAYKNTLFKLNDNIKIGYMCLAEQRPNTGESNFIEKTIYFFEDYFEQNYEQKNKIWYTYFSKCHYANKTPDVYATDESWEKFVIDLIQ